MYIVCSGGLDSGSFIGSTCMLSVFPISLHFLIALMRISDLSCDIIITKTIKAIKHVGTRCYKKLISDRVVWWSSCSRPTADHFLLDFFNLDFYLLMNILFIFTFVMFHSQVRTLTRRSAKRPWKWLRSLLNRRTTPVKPRYAACCLHVLKYSSRTFDLYIFC